MDENLELISWFKRMGYNAEIPESLDNICNGSTSFIWIQLMQNAKPKQEADNVKNNILIHHLKNGALNEQNDQFSCTSKEINLYIKKRALETKLNHLRSIIKEKKHKLNNLSQNNKIKYIAIEKLKSNVKENEQREYLLRKRYKALESSIQDTEEIMTYAKNLTPVELEENPNTKEITETLEKCSKKLEKLLHNIPLPSQCSYNRQSVTPFSSAQKLPKCLSNFEKLLVMSERKKRHFPKCTNSVLVNQANKENIEHTEVKKKINTILFKDNNQTTSQNKRESLGILHESYLKENNNFNFLTCELEDAAFLSPLTTLSNKNISSCVTKPRTTGMNVDVISYDQLSISMLSQSKNYNSSPEGFRLEALYGNEFVINNLKTLLYSHNREIIWNTIQTLNENLNLDITKNVIFNSEQSSRYCGVNQGDIAKLHFLHVQTELQTLKLKMVNKELCNKIERKKKQIYVTIGKKDMSPVEMDSFERLFEEQLNHVGLDLVLAEMKKEINSAKKSVDSSDLQTILRKIKQTKDNIITKIGSIKHYIDSIHETLFSTISTREQTKACVRKLGPFVEDLSWSALLTQNLCSNEIKLLEKFPLYYNRRCIHTEPRMYYRDIAQNIPTNIDLDSESIYMLTSVLGSPFSPPEMILLDMLKSKMKLQALKSLQTFCPNIQKQYLLKELQAQENYVQYALDKLNSIMYSTSSNKTLATAKLMKKIIDIWVEMPIKDFVSTKRVLEGKTYFFYEKNYDSFYNNF